MLTDIAIADEYSGSIEGELLGYFPTLTSTPNFNGAVWYFDKLRRSAGHAPHSYKIYFAGIPDKYINVVRFWVLLRVRNGMSITSTSGGVVALGYFLGFLVKEAAAPNLSGVNRMVIEAYEEHLRSRCTGKKSTKELRWTAVANFFRDMQTWPQMPAMMPVPTGNPFSRTELDRKHDQRLVPEMVLEQLDEAYRDESVPLEDRLTYWILRSIPSRISEVCSIDLDCLRPYEFNGRKGFILTIPEWKQSANQHRPRKKLVHILDEGHGKFLLDMVREQQRIAKIVENVLPGSKRGYLMVALDPRRSRDVLLRKAVEVEPTLFGDTNTFRCTAFILTQPRVLIRMKKLVSRAKVSGPDGSPYDALTHCFRHNGVTERLYEGFSFVEIRDMTGHHGNQMLSTAYVHVNADEIKARAKERREKGEQGPPILFQGRIMNLSPEKAARLLENPRAFRIGNLGICSDVTSCKNDLFECLDCDDLVPDADNEDYYVTEHEKWRARASQHAINGNKSLAEHARYMSLLHEKLLGKIRLSLLMRTEMAPNDN